jgi:4-alpha-glucanotransferase
VTDATAWGVDQGYYDVQGHWRAAPKATIEALLSAMGAGDGRPPGLGDDNPVWVVRSGDRVRVDGPWTLTTEDGATLEVDGRVPRDLPLGYHRLERATDGRHVRLIVSPGQCHLPTDMRSWGWALQLYALRSQSSWGMGDLGDLRRFGTFAADQGAGLVMLNPLHAALPDIPQQPSPYYPSSRCFRNLLYLRVAEIAGAAQAGGDLEKLDRQGQALNRDRRIRRDDIYELKLGALETIFAGFDGSRDFDRYCRDAGPALDGYATFCALAEVQGGSWRSWPDELRHPSSPAVAEFRQDFERRITFHRWVQWLLDQQLRSAGDSIGLVQDLAIGVDPSGADSWLWQEAFADGIRVGAPPDEFNVDGQDWGLPPFDPWKLRMAGFEPFIQTVRSMLAHAAGLRFDHVMGLFRLFWIPPGAGPADGTYVRYPWEELLDILALESHRAGAWVVGEDLGTVEDFVRSELARRNVLSYRLLWFEPEPPPEWPERSLGAVTTHDLPTVAGMWTGHDVEHQREIGVTPNEQAADELRRRVRTWLGIDGDAPVAEVVEGCHRLLGSAASMVVTASLDDALEADERPNYPGTTDEHPNWSIALPSSLEEIERDPRVALVGETLAARRHP